ncbi:two-component system sensor histidine kinase NtrB [Desulfolutivibrio sulfoxidireducens]|uniref:two-component system sensor histidine kinase NtrB n=1 Tax=Desulfolutivibrio sulfoxidireducens TaxID=2773299 RepID=UPI00159E5961|nr:ATP-binding protein [Desulfolutivibrio sulfoxidireducens]QLA16382.1 PAS domain-containing protein [Desulfolutivibrio sulfoxidireducens]QLA19737.1 PAS domain-containing protein [Desulfolutivibrio sulfoxidireducens]
MPSPRRIIEENILQSIPVGLLVIDRTGRVAAAGPAVSDILGLPDRRLLGRYWREVLWDDPQNAEFNDLVTQAAERRANVRQRQVSYRTPDGRPLRLSVNASFLQKAGKMVGVVYIFEDVTELHRFRERETRVLREKNRLQHDLIESLGNLALSVAHQIRNPMVAIGGFSRKLREFLKNRSLSTEYADIIFAEALHLEGVVGAVVRLASIPRPKPMASPLSPLFGRVVAEAEHAASRAGRTVAWDVAVEDGECLMDQGLIHLALTEILRNAVEFSGKGDLRIRMHARPEGDVWRVVVSDSGPGVAPGNLPFVFDPFFSTKPRGAGIGLTMVRKIVMEHGGEVSVHSSPGAGTRITVRLPRADPENMEWAGESGPAGSLVGEDLDACSLIVKARQAGVNIMGLSAVDAVREIQMAEGFEPCFGRGGFDACGQEQCFFRSDCMKLKRVEAPCRISYRGRWDSGAVPGENGWT